MAPTEMMEDDNVTDYMFHDQSDPSEPDMSFYIDNPPLTEMECANYNNSLLQEKDNIGYRRRNAGCRKRVGTDTDVKGYIQSPAVRERTLSGDQRNQWPHWEDIRKTQPV
ncbi:hypothetical protein CDAR_210171 [Caerostris darwini]|uniref:Uncharacterized protein n=1 Tax=Caerostris darwini TaxID=1538125 RepID=A0AAV4SQJ4_9ARAC|nr:hypothetical protein CDAR_210171 [Caerostris darwini]